MTFFLQDVSNGRPLTSANTLAQVTVKGLISTRPTGSISANPNPFTPDVRGLGQTTLTWTSAITNKVEVHVNAPDGNRLATSGPGSFSVTTGQWVRNGMTFYLQDVSNGQPLTSANTLESKSSLRICATALDSARCFERTLASDRPEIASKNHACSSASARIGIIYQHD